MSLVVVMTTVPSRPQAEELARKVVEKHLGACVQMVAVESVYVWDGLQQDAEVRLEIKTTEEAVPRLVERFAEWHPYDEPEVIALPVLTASEGYGDWVKRQVRL